MKNITQNTKSDYKHTELGIIPKNWNWKLLSDIAKIERGKFTHRPRNDPEYYDGDYPFIQTGDVVSSNGKITTFTQTLNEKGLSVSKLFSEKIIVITIAANIGNTAITTFPVCFPDSIIGISTNKLDIEYLEYFLRTKKKFLNKIATNSAQKNINLETFKSIYILVPDQLNEQEKISVALSDIDNLINNFKKLIEKKKNIHKGTMQELLTSKRRLKKFTDKWEIIELGKIIDINKGEQLNRSTLSSNDPYPVWNGGMGSSGTTTKYNQIENTIIISEGGNSCGYVNYLFTKFWAGGHCYTLNNPKLELNKFFLFQILKNYEKSIMKLRVGTGLPNIQKKRISKFPILLPSTKEEQDGIAEILYHMNSEINKLEKKKAKYKMIKDGMMQKLLTGEIRIK
jgi:type I restriction enzyme, S subunit